MINIYLDPKQKDTQDEICSICHDKFDNNKYEIPECKHYFHTSCVIEWYRTGNIRCPYCNSTPSILDEDHMSYYGSRRLVANKYKIISNYCRRNNANVHVKKKVESIRKLNDKLKDMSTEMTNLTNEDGSYKEIKTKLSSLRRSKWSTQRIIYNKKKELTEIVNIIPYILKK